MVIFCKLIILIIPTISVRHNEILGVTGYFHKVGAKSGVFFLKSLIASNFPWKIKQIN